VGAGIVLLVTGDLAQAELQRGDEARESERLAEREALAGETLGGDKIVLGIGGDHAEVVQCGGHTQRISVVPGRASASERSSRSRAAAARRCRRATPPAPPDSARRSWSKSGSSRERHSSSRCPPVPSFECLNNTQSARPEGFCTSGARRTELKINGGLGLSGTSKALGPYSVRQSYRTLF
jgi:hypothetical protein